MKDLTGKKVLDMISRMTLEEKIGQMQQYVFNMTGDELQQNLFFSADNEMVEEFKAIKSLHLKKTEY